MGGKILDFLTNILILVIFSVWAIVTCGIVLVFGVMFLPFILTMYIIDYIKEKLKISHENKGD